MDSTIGTKRHRLTATSEPYKKNTKRVYYLDYICDCGETGVVQKDVFLRGEQKSCGCYKLEKLRGPKTFIPVGSLFGRLRIIEDCGNLNRSHRYYSVQCDCGSEPFKIRADALTAKQPTISCGCVQKEDAKSRSTKHGMSTSPTYKAWTSMKQRCTNPSIGGYEYYGGRGITYDPRWEKFENFYEDMGECPDGFELDRLDNDMNYSWGNCQWADGTWQSFNRRKQCGKTSQYIGVSYNAATNMWDAALTKNGETVFRKLFLSEEDAARAVDVASLKHYGVKRNFVDKEEDESI